MVFEIYQSRQVVSADKAASDTFSMFPNAADEVVGDTDVQSAIAPVRHDVNRASHARMLYENGKEDVDGRAAPGHDDWPQHESPSASFGITARCRRDHRRHVIGAG
jgi:hypothetical protein